MMLVVRPAANLRGLYGPDRKRADASAGPAPPEWLAWSRVRPRARCPISTSSRLRVPWRALPGAWEQGAAVAAPSAAASAEVVLPVELTLAVPLILAVAPPSPRLPRSPDLVPPALGASHAMHGHPAPEKAKTAWGKLQTWLSLPSLRLLLPPRLASALHRDARPRVPGCQVARTVARANCMQKAKEPHMRRHKEQSCP
jgi:hypothetical protein